MTLEKIFSILKKYISQALYLFAIYLSLYVVITFFVFGNYVIPINYIAYILIVALLASVVLSIIININHLTAIIQGLLVYITILVSTYCVGFFTNCFTRTSAFFIASIIINLIGLCILFVGIIIKRTFENKKLNETLQSYKEREHK